MSTTLDTHQRALQINLDPRFFGTFAEIGAGQEVARWFLQVGGAAGTVAKTISAYDMTFSDAIYGKGSRYVSRDRLVAMLDHEHTLLRERLDESRGADTQFFVFADTVAARNYSGTNECHGWMGVRFTTEPRGEPSDLLLHVNLMDSTNLSQQRAIGILGVNILHAAFYPSDSKRSLLETVFSDLSLSRIEVDVVEARGPAFANLDRRRMGVRLVHDGLAQAVLYRPDGTLVAPSEVLRKRPVVLERGMFERLLPLHHQMLEGACETLLAETTCDREPLPIPELSVRPLGVAEPLDTDEIESRLEKVLALESPVLLTRFPEIYHLTGYLRRYTQAPVRFVLGASTLVRVFHAAHYSKLMGGLLEGLGHLFGDEIKVYVYPMEADAFRAQLEAAGVPVPEIRADDQGLVGAGNLCLEAPVGHLYDYLREEGWVMPVKRRDEPHRSN